MDKRLNKLETMKGDLENFHGDLDQLDQWMNDANREIQAIQHSLPEAHDSNDTDHLLGAYKVRTKITRKYFTCRAL